MCVCEGVCGIKLVPLNFNPNLQYKYDNLMLLLCSFQLLQAWTTHVYENFILSSSSHGKKKERDRYNKNKK